MAKIRGFTLIEMLVAMVLLSSTILIATQAYRQFVVSGERFSHKYRTELQALQNRSIIKERLRYSLLYLSRKSSDFTTSRVYPFWLGSKDQLVAVTRHSLTAPNMAAVYSLFLEDHSLIYCERLVSEYLPFADRVPQGLCEQRFVVAEGVSSLAISYYGWPSYTDFLLAQSSQVFLGESNPQRWFQNYIGHVTGLVPDWFRVTVTFRNDEEEVWLISVKGQDPMRLNVSQTAVEG